MMNKTILVIGTYDTKDDELGFLAEVIQAQGGQVVTMDVSLFQTRCCARRWKFDPSGRRLGQ